METMKINNSGQLPRAVYFQCIWLVKDMARLEAMSCRLLEHESSPDEIVLYMDEYSHFQTEAVIEESRRRLTCIKSALEEIPEEYREAIIANITELKAFDDRAHDNTWKKWKQRFIYAVARNMKMY